MNRLMINFIFFSAGAALSALVTSSISKKSFRKKINEAVDKEVENVKRQLSERYEKKLVENVKKEQDAEPEKKEEFKGSEVELDKGLIFDQTESERFQNTAKAVQQTEPEIKKPVEDDYPDMNDVTAKPFLIKDKDFGDQENCCSWILWADGVVTTNDGYASTVDPKYVSDVLPNRWKEMFGWDETDTYKDILYFRNNQEAMDFEIVRDNRKYSDWLKENFE